jgi:mRNA-degrading endonuclease RelE of RelBE toxin-antitoxin system
MTYDLRDSFLEAAYALPKEIGKKIWKSLRGLSMNPRPPGLALERLHGKAEGLWSIRVGEKHRAIVQIDVNTTTLLFVGTHQDAYRYAEKPQVAPPASMRSVREAKTFHQLSAPAPKRKLAPARSRTAKYTPLARHLLHAATMSTPVEMTFSEIEQLLNASLPASARRHRPWWANDASGGHVQATAWLAVGWRVAKVSLTRQRVLFELEG